MSCCVREHLPGLPFLVYILIHFTMATSTSTQPFKRHSIVFSPRQSRYVKMGEELQRCLEEMFPEEHSAGYKFMIKVGP